MPRKCSLVRNPNTALHTEEEPNNMSRQNPSCSNQGPFSSAESKPDTMDRKAVFSIDRTFSASSEFFDDDDDDREEGPSVILNQHKTTEARRREFFQQFEDVDEISSGLPSDLPSGLVDIEGNIIEKRELQFGQEEDEDDEDDYFGENEKHVHNNNHSTSSAIEDQPNSQMNGHHYPNSSSNSNNEDINNESVRNASGSKSGIHRKKSILRQSHDKGVDGDGAGCVGGVSVNSFNGSAGSSSIISDGKMGSMNGSFNSQVNSQFYNNFYSRAARRNDFQRYTRGPYAPLDRCNSNSASSANTTISSHYYPEGGWGYVVLATAMFSHALLCGFLLGGGVFATKVLERFEGHEELRAESVWLTSLSLGASLLLSPLWVSICKRKSTRLSGVFGGLVASLGCLFTSFASQFHQLYFSYVIFMGVGVGLTRDASMLMVGQYFKRKRDFVEMLLVSSSGIGILVMPVFMEYALSAIGWRLGLQGITGSLALTFFLGSCYRSASLYHPQRRAIIHLKNQKRKIKEKEKKGDISPFLDVTCLASRSLQSLLFSSALTAWGMFSPLFLLALECQDEALGETDTMLTYVYIGAGWIIGAWIFGFLAIQRNEECRISKLYLCQVAALLCGVSIIALTNVKESSGLVPFSWLYGIGMGGYHYMLKIHTYEKVRARVFPRAWSFIQSVQGAALMFGVPVTGYINKYAGKRKGYFLSAGAIFLGFFIMCLSAVGSRRLTRHKSSRSSMKTETTDSLQSPGLRRISFTFPDEQSPPRISKDERSSSSSERSRISRNGNHSHSEQQMIPKELTRISEEGILDTNH